MVTREEVVAEIAKVPEKRLAELHQIIKAFEVKPEEESQENFTIMAKLRRIRISASPDFSTKANLYNLEETNAE